MARTFSKKGLRRDQNFADLLNPRESLNNLLNDLVQEAGETFISEDLDAIREIRSTPMQNRDFLNIANIAPRVVNDSNQLVTFDPVIKVKNRIDQIKFTTGEPRFFSGNGLTAKYYEDSQIDSDAPNVADIFSGEPAGQEVFWENGNFNFITIPEIQDIYGGVSFTGYFIPTRLGIWSIPFSTTGFFTAEFDDGTGSYELLKRKSQIEYAFTVEAASAGSAVLVLQNSNNDKNILVGDRVVSSSISQFNDPENPVFVTQVIGGQVQISEPLDANISAGESITFEFQFGFDGGSSTLVLGNLQEYAPYVIRFQYWFPEEDFVSIDMIRSLNIDLTPPASQTTNLNYKYLYSEDYDITPTAGSVEYGDFAVFYDNRLSLAGGTVGGTGSYDDYQQVQSLSPLNITYEPPTTFAEIQNTTKTLSYIADFAYLSVTITDSIEVGNYVFGLGIPAGTRVTGIATNQTVFLDTPPISIQVNDTVTFVDHRGLVAFDVGASWTSGSNSITGLSTNTTDTIKVGDIVVLNGSPPYNRVASIASTSITTTANFTASSSADMDGIAFFYQANGLINDSLRTYCQNVFSSVTTAQSNAGSNILTVDTDTNLAVGQVVQFGSRIPEGTTVLSITPAGGDFDIELSNNITDTITSDQLITFAPSGTTDSKEICFTPTDTSPPFTATTEGLETTNTRPSMTVNPVSGTGELRFVGLSANGVVVETANSTSTYDRTVTITDGTGSTYKILGTTT